MGNLANHPRPFQKHWHPVLADRLKKIQINKRQKKIFKKKNLLIQSIKQSATQHNVHKYEEFWDRRKPILYLQVHVKLVPVLLYDIFSYVIC